MQDIDADLLALVEKGLIEYAYDEEREDWVFWLKEGVVIEPNRSD